MLFACAADSYADRPQVMRARVIKQLQEIQTLFEQEQYAQVLAATTRLKDTDLPEYELWQVLTIEAYTHINLAANTAAIAILRQILTYDGLPQELRQNTLNTLVQLYMMEEQHSLALATADELIAVALAPEPGHAIFKGQALYYLERHEQALAEIDRALTLARDKSLPLLEPWLLLKNAALFELDRVADMIEVMRLLLTLYPKDRYITNLSALYSQLDMPEKQLTLLEPLYEQGGLSQAYHLISLASLYMALGTPYKAGKVLQQSLEEGRIEADFDNLDLLGKAWQLADERARAIDAYNAAAELSEGGDILVRIAHLHIAAGDWRRAEASLDRAFAKGDLSEPGNAHILRGMARFSQKKLPAARRAFIQAAKFSEAQLHAEQWLGYVDAEIKSRRSLPAVL
ncbi:hypothetical protein FKG94_22005 [Exilibacterium tricleocarpae]|uniref:Tetratricopeptide repeat protein n=1 Tax=Exilibacterium tricleocarpae TaxID=2591008 RepID=A0A545SYZ1_9GAMM|nr:hypothetical protein [Exilibacterium tricleocarpae]TQV70192.1 hypothetical protein FKG94_22005 [Exilibacterium tricleocarpae]